MKLLSLFLAAVTFFLLLTMPARADVIRLDCGPLQIDVQGDINAIGFLNAIHRVPNDQILNGFDTTVGYIPISKAVKLDLSLGAITGPVNTGIPFASIGYSWPCQPGSFLSLLNLINIQAGIGASCNFEQSGYRWQNVDVGLVVTAKLLNL